MPIDIELMGWLGVIHGQVKKSDFSDVDRYLTRARNLETADLEGKERLRICKQLVAIANDCKETDNKKERTFFKHVCQDARRELRCITRADATMQQKIIAQSRILMRLYATPSRGYDRDAESHMKILAPILKRNPALKVEFQRLLQSARRQQQMRQNATAMAYEADLKKYEDSLADKAQRDADYVEEQTQLGNFCYGQLSQLDEPFPDRPVVSQGASGSFSQPQPPEKEEKPRASSSSAAKRRRSSRDVRMFTTVEVSEKGGTGNKDGDRHRHKPHYGTRSSKAS